MPPKKQQDTPAEVKVEKPAIDSREGIASTLMVDYAAASITGNLDHSLPTVASAGRTGFDEPAADSLTGNVTQSQSFKAAGDYKQWQERFGFSMEEEGGWEAQEQASVKAAKTKNLSPTKRSSPSKREQEPSTKDSNKERRRESYDPIEEAGLAPDAGTKLTYDFTDVDDHAIVKVGATPVSQEKPAAAQLEALIAQLVEPYMLSTWRQNEFDIYLFRVRAIFRWITHFIRLTPNPLPPPAQPVAKDPTTASAKDATASFQPGKKGNADHGGNSSFVPFKADDDDDNSDEEPLDLPIADTPDPTRPKSDPVAPQKLIGEATAVQVFTDRSGDCHQVSTLFAFMVRHPAARIVPPHNTLKTFGHISIPQKLEDVGADSIALHSVRETVACPTGICKQQVSEALGSNPEQTLHKHEQRYAHCGTHPCKISTVRGTLKGVLDKNGKTQGFIPWSWNVLTLPDGKRYLIDIALCMTIVPLRYHLNYASMLDLLKDGQAVAPFEGANPQQPPAKAGKGKEEKQQDPSLASAQAAPSFHVTAAQAAAATRHLELLSTEQTSTTEKGTTGFSSAPILFSGSSMSPYSAPFAAGTPAPPAGFDTSTAPTPSQAVSATLLTRTFQPFYFFTDPRQFAALHYPDKQRHLLLGGVVQNDSTFLDPKASRRRQSSGLFSKAAWEIYPRLTHEFFENGLHLVSHARRTSFNVKGCPEYISIACDDPQSVELKVQLFKCPIPTLVGTTPCAAPLNPSTSQSFAGSSTVPETSALAQWAQNQNAQQATFFSGTIQPSLTAQPFAMLDPRYSFVSREENTKAAVFTLMMPDIGLHTVVVGARKICRVSGKPVTPFFSVAAMYHIYVSFVPTNEPVLPLLHEPPSLAKLVSPSMGKLVFGPTYFSVVATSPRVAAVAVVNKVFASVIPGKKTVEKVVDAAPPPPPGKGGKMDKAAAAAAALQAQKDEEAAAAAAAALAQGQVQNKVERVQAWFLPFDSKDATFNGTVSIEIGLVELWVLGTDDNFWELADQNSVGNNFAPIEVEPADLGLTTLPPGTPNTNTEGEDQKQIPTVAESWSAMVPLHLMPLASQSSTAALAQMLIFQPMRQPTDLDQTATQTGLPGPAEVLGMTGTTSVSAANAAESNSQAKASQYPETARFVAAIGQQQAAAGLDVPEEPEEQEPAPAPKGKAAPPPPPKKPAEKKNPIKGTWVPLISSISVVKRLSSKDATLYTNGWVSSGSAAAALAARGIRPQSKTPSALPPFLVFPVNINDERTAINRLLAMRSLDHPYATRKDKKKPTVPASPVKERVGGYFGETLKQRSMEAQ